MEKANKSIIILGNFNLKDKPDRFLTLVFRIAFTLFFLTCLQYNVFSQTGVTINELVLGKVEVSSPVSVKMTAGFRTSPGAYFRAYIAATQTLSTYSIPAIFPTTNSTAGTTTKNYVKTTVYNDPSTTNSTPRLQQSFVYYDGLGRPIQTVNVGASPMGRDIIQLVIYDVFGRELYKVLPYTEPKSGAFRTGVTTTTVDGFYNTSSDFNLGVEEDTRAYVQIGYDNSPLNQILTQTGPGNAWASKPVTINHLVNSETVSGWNIDESGNFVSFSYAVNTLLITETIDEQGNITREYKDKEGKVVQKSSKLVSDWLCTAYIYDDFGLLRCVVPPQAIDPTSTYANLCYYYAYDSRHRLIEKKIPGGGIIKFAYDSRDRLRCSQNSVQANNSEWSFTKYDNLNRVVVSGTVIYTSDIKTGIGNGQLNESASNHTLG